MADKYIFNRFFLKSKSKLVSNLSFTFSVLRLVYNELMQFFIHGISVLSLYISKFKSADARVKTSGESVQNSLPNLSFGYVAAIRTFIINKFNNYVNCKKSWGLCACVIGCFTVILGLLVGFVSYIEEYEIRRKVNSDLLVADSADLLKYKWNNDEKFINSSYRASIDFENILGISESENDMEQTESMLVFTAQGVRFLDSIQGSSIDLSLGKSSIIPVVPFDNAQDAVLLAGTFPTQYGEPLDEIGYPIRWNNSRQDISSNFRLTCISPLSDGHDTSTIEKIVLMQAKLFPNFSLENLYIRASRYKPYIEKSSRRFGISPDLVYAIIYNESNFWTGSVSPRSARGLMQLMPDTARNDVHSFLYGNTGNFNLGQLFDPETNINYGTAYLYLLLNRDLVEIKNKITREYCAIASYNMGPNGFLRLFSKDRAKAIQKINSMTSQEVLVKLTTRLPIVETRDYVDRVVKSRNVFVNY